MTPKTKLQRQVVDLSAKLPSITDKQKAWGFEKCLDHYGYERKGSVQCLECSHTFPGSGKQETCPNCGNILKLSNKWKDVNNSAYYGMITAIEGFQVIRLFWVQRKYMLGEKSFPFFQEVAQAWISPDGEKVHRGIRVNGMGGVYFDKWIFGTDMEIRTYHHRYEISPFRIHPTIKASDNVKRNGFTGAFYGLNPVDFFTAILTDPKAETLLKAGQIPMLKRFVGVTWMDRFWPSIKICIRNKYLIKDPGMWSDYMTMLKKLDKDLHNAKYVCPADVKAEHDRLIPILQKRDAEYAEAKYRERKGMFFGIGFTEGNILVKVLESVEEFKQEGAEMNHCVYSSSYHEKEDSLILSARRGEKRIETVEVSLSKMKVVQCHGPNNKNTRYHKRIINLVERNIQQIQQRKKIAV